VDKTAMADALRPSKRAKYVSTSVPYKYIRLTTHRHDFSSTFDVLVGQLPGNVKRFTVHTDVFTQVSRFFAAARKPEWITSDATKPKQVDLSDEDPNVFQAYLNCVYDGLETLEDVTGASESEVLERSTGTAELYIRNLCEDVTKEILIAHFDSYCKISDIDVSQSYGPSSKYESPHYANIPFTTAKACGAALKACDGLVFRGHRVQAEAFCHSWDHKLQTIVLADIKYDSLINLYLLADKLQDLATTNMVMDTIQQFCQSAYVAPGKGPISTAYQSTVAGSPLRKLLRDMWSYSPGSDHEERFNESGFPNEFLRDIVKEYLRIKPESDDVKHYFEVASNDYLLEGSESETPDGCRYH
jgi:hypothetical protein